MVTHASWTWTAAAVMVLVLFAGCLAGDGDATVGPVLELRFGELEPVVRKRVRELDSLDDLERLSERVLTASSLEEMGLG